MSDPTRLNGVHVIEGVVGGVPVAISGTVAASGTVAVSGTVATTLSGTPTVATQYLFCTKTYGTNGVITPGTATFSPPLHTIWAVGAGTVTLRLSGDSTATVSIPLAANTICPYFEFVQCTTATATGISGAG